MLLFRQPAMFELQCTKVGFNLKEIEERVSVCAFLSQCAQQLSNLLEVGDICVSMLCMSECK